jgi:hypothetical protein
MAGLTVDNSRVVAAPTVAVRVNDRNRSDIECLSVALNASLAASRASFTVPRWLSDEGLGTLENQEVVVLAGNGSLESSRPLFRGWFEGDGRQEDGDRQDVQMGAVSVLGKLNEVYVGQKKGVGAVEYLRAEDGGPAGQTWTLSQVLKDLFAPENFPADWRAIVDLGDISAIQSVEGDIRLPSLVFSAATYRAALTRLMGLAGRVGIRERFTASKTLLDFYLVNDGRLPAREIWFSGGGVEVTDGALGVELVHRSEVARTRNRVVGYGKQAELMVTVTSDPSGWGGLQAPLVPAWANATAYGSSLATDPAELTGTEQVVLANPEKARPKSPTFDPQYRNVFQLFRLPEHVRQHTILDRNVLKDSTGKAYQVQFFRQKYDYAEVGSGGVDLRGTVNATDWELISGAEILEGGYVRFPEPMVDVYEYQSASKKQLNVYRRMHVGVTLTIAHKEIGLRYDTGASGAALPNLANEGEVLSFRNPRLGFELVATGTDALVDSTGDGATYGVLYYDLETNQWRSVAAGSPVIVVDDRALIGEICEARKSEIDAAVITDTVGLPGVWKFSVGEVIRVRNRNTDNVRLMIREVKINVADPSTRIVASNAPAETVNVQVDSRGGGLPRSTTGAAMAETNYNAMLNRSSARMGAARKGLGGAPSASPSENYNEMLDRSQAYMSGTVDWEKLLG